MTREEIASAPALDEARAQLAAVREAVREVLSEPHAYVGGRERALLDAALSDTAPAAAEAYTRRVRAEALREAAACAVDGLRLWGRKAQGDASEWLRARADEIERGER